MTPEIAIERVRSFLHWCGDKFESLEGQHGAIADPLGWRRGGEYWIPSTSWHQIFDNDEDAALIAAQALRDHGLLRTQAGPSLQCNVKIRKEVRRCYCVSEKILTWQPPSRGSNGSTPAQNGLPYGQVNALPVLISLPPPPAFPENFNELPPGERQNHLLASAMYLQTHLLSLSLRLAPADAKAIAQLASVAQGIVSTSVKLEQIKAERQDNGERSERIADIIRQITETCGERDKEDARLAREKGYCDDSLSDRLAAEIYREKNASWNRKPDWPPA
jgi:hypothetical protein